MRQFTLCLIGCGLSTLMVCAQNTGYTISTLAGGDGLNDGGSALKTLLRQPIGIALDPSGSLYISDSLDNRIRKITAGIVSTVAGDGIPGYSGDGGQAIAALIDSPGGIASDLSGNVYFADRGNNVIRKIAPDGTISTVAGNGKSTYNGENVPANQAQFHPQTVAVDSTGNIYIADSSNPRILKVGSNGLVSTVAGNGAFGYSGDGGPAKIAEIGVVFGIAVDDAGNIYLADLENFAVRKIDSAGMMSTIAGTGPYLSLNGATAALNTLMFPSGLAADSNGHLYITDALNNQVFLVNLATGDIQAIVGNGQSGFSGEQGFATAVPLGFPLSPVMDAKGNLYFVDSDNHRVREVSGSRLQTVAGSSAGDGGAALQAYLDYPEDAALDGNGNLVIADTSNSELRRVSAASRAINSIGTFGITTDWGNPISLAIDASGNTYTGTDESYVVKTSTGGQTSVVAGTGTAGKSGDGNPAGLANVDTVSGAAFDSSGNLYLADSGQQVIREIDNHGNISTIAGTGQAQANGDDGPAKSAGLNPLDIAADGAGNLYIADTANERIRKIGADGKISTVAGTGRPGYTGDGGPATQAALSLPTSIAAGRDGNLFICDEGNGVIRRVDGRSGIISTVAGTGTLYPISGSSGPARGVNLDPHRVRLGPGGTLIVTDQANNRIYQLSPYTISLAHLVEISGDGQSGATGTSLPAALTVKATGNDGFGYPGLEVTFAITNGTATVNPSKATTDANGVASTVVTLGQQAGKVVITASAAGLPPVTFTLTAGSTATIGAGGVVGAGLSDPPVAALSPGGIVTIFGAQFAAAGTRRQVSPEDLVDGNLPTNLANTCVFMGGTVAPLFYVSDVQINAQVPVLPVSSNVTVQVAVNCGQPDEVRSSPAVLPSQSTTPEFFYFSHGQNGKDYVAALNGVTNANIGPAGLAAGATFTPAKPGDIVTVFGTGFGPASPAITPGVPSPGAAKLTSPVSVKLGDVTLSTADVLYAGVAPTYAGLYQLNIRVPQNAGAGDLPLVITIGGVSSPANAVLTVSQ